MAECWERLLDNKVVLDLSSDAAHQMTVISRLRSNSGNDDDIQTLRIHPDLLEMGNPLFEAVHEYLRRTNSLQHLSIDKSSHFGSDTYDELIASPTSEPVSLLLCALAENPAVQLTSLLCRPAVVSAPIIEMLVHVKRATLTTVSLRSTMSRRATTIRGRLCFGNNKKTIDVTLDHEEHWKACCHALDTVLHKIFLGCNYHKLSMVLQPIHLLPRLKAISLCIGCTKEGVQSSGLKDLAKITALKTLAFVGGKARSFGCHALPSVTKLVLRSIEFSSKCRFPQLYALRYLKLSGCRMMRSNAETTSIQTAFYDLLFGCRATLSMLDVSGNSLTWLAPLLVDILPHLCHLETFKLLSIKLEESQYAAFCQALENCTKLQILVVDMSVCRALFRHPHVLQALPGLQRLVLERPTERNDLDIVRPLLHAMAAHPRLVLVKNLEAVVETSPEATAVVSEVLVHVARKRLKLASSLPRGLTPRIVATLGTDSDVLFRTLRSNPEFVNVLVPFQGFRRSR